MYLTVCDQHLPQSTWSLGMLEIESKVRLCLLIFIVDYVLEFGAEKARKSCETTINGEAP
jgi:hypothetical protein